MSGLSGTILYAILGFSLGYLFSANHSNRKRIRNLENIAFFKEILKQQSKSFFKDGKDV